LAISKLQGANCRTALEKTGPKIRFPAAGFDLFPNGGGQNAGVTSGLQGGYNYQIGSFVPGLETDINYLENCRSGTFAAPPAYIRLGVSSYTLSSGCASYFGTLRARLGYAYDRALFFATAGIAFGGNRNRGSVTLNPVALSNYFPAGDSHSARTKYVFGAGVEYALTDHWFARAEYQFVNLGRIDQFFSNFAGQAYTSSQFTE
jgi:high affinity Mn2+ porin